MATVPVSDILKGVHFKGGCFTDRDVALIPSGGYSMIMNKRATHDGFDQRKGCRRLHVTADGGNRVDNQFQFSKGKQTERHFYAQMSDGDVLDAVTAPPGIGTDVFGPEVYSATGTTIPASFGVVQDRLLFADGTSVPQIYAGNNEYVSGFIVYKGAATIPTIPLLGEDYSLEVSTDDNTLYADLDDLSTLAAFDCIFIKTDVPADVFTWAIKTANASGALFKLYYWKDAWTEVAGFADNTVTAGATLAKDGTMTWTMTTDHVPHYMFGQSGYWYRLALDSGVLGADVKVYTVKFNSDWLPMQNVWDGIPIGAIESYVYINSSASYKFFPSTAIEIGALTASDKYYFNSVDPSIGAYVSVGSVPNTTAATGATVKYWNGTIFTAVASQSDGTLSDSKSHAQDGWITWPHPAAEQKTMFQSSQYFSYWYEISFDQTLTADMSISIETKPYLTLREFGKCIALAPFKRRMAYAFDKLPGNIAISASAHPSVLNGITDYRTQEIGDGRDNKVVCMKAFYNELLVFQEERGTDGGCITLVQGYSPDTYGKLIVSNRYGTINAKSVVVVDGCRMQVVSGESLVTLAFFISRSGVFSTNGNSAFNISRGENSSIQNYFDPKEPECLNLTYSNKCWIAYDSAYHCLRLGLVSGASATECNVFPVYDITDQAWSFDNPAQPFSCAAEIEAASGDVNILQVSGGVADGFIYQSNYGTTDVSTAIDSYVTMEIDGLGAEILMRGFILRKSGTCVLTPYVDGAAQPTITVSS